MADATRRVVSSDGVGLAVYEQGDPSAPTVLAVHGYPDNQTVWDGVAAQLADRYHVVSYDVRGTGASDKPAAVRDYRMPRLVDDLGAVVDAVRPGGPVHLLAHDWGSIQSWPALTDPRLAGRIATFTSISGPSLDHSAAWLRRGRGYPGAALRQLAHSYYIALFQLPRLPELAVRRGLLDRGLARAGGQRDRPLADQINGIALYRANVGGRLARPHPEPVRQPVQVIVPEQDPFVTPRLASEAPAAWVRDLTVRRVPGGHWIVTSRPDVIAELVAGFVARSGRPRPS